MPVTQGHRELLVASCLGEADIVQHKKKLIKQDLGFTLRSLGARHGPAPENRDYLGQAAASELVHCQ